MEKLIKRQGMPLKSTFAECVAAPDYKLYIVKKRLSEKYGVIRRDKTDIVPFLFDRYEVIELNDGYIIALTKDNIRQYCLYHSKFGTILNKCLDKFEIKISDIEERKKPWPIGAENIDKIINIDQSPIGRTPRSNPATYTGLFTYIRVNRNIQDDIKTIHVLKAEQHTHLLVRH